MHIMYTISQQLGRIALRLVIYTSSMSKIVPTFVLVNPVEHTCTTQKEQSANRPCYVLQIAGYKEY